MKYLTFFLLSFGLFGQRQDDHPEISRNYPWAKNRFTYHAVYQTVDAQGRVLSERVAPNEWVNMVIVDDESSGWHSHGSDADPRPAQIPFAEHVLNTAAGETPTRLLTNANGDAVFAWRGNGYSGSVTTLLVADSVVFPSEKFHEYLAYTDYEQVGSSFTAKYLKPINGLGILGDLMDYSRHNDTRHLNNAGFPGNSRYATSNSGAAMEMIAQYYRLKHNLHLELDLIRSSLPDGGCADNKMLAGGTTAYQYLTWKYRGCNNVGVEFDLENPAIQAGGVGTPAGDYSWDLFEFAAYHAVGCQAAKFQDDGITRIPDANLYGHTSYWYSQPVIRMVCTFSPTQLIQ